MSKISVTERFCKNCGKPVAYVQWFSDWRHLNTKSSGHTYANTFCFEFRTAPKNRRWLFAEPVPDGVFSPIEEQAI